MTRKKKIIIGVSIGAILILSILALLFINRNYIIDNTPTLTIETPQRISISKAEDFTLDVTISSFGEANYPAASMSISFDSSRLEFIGVEEGNVFISNSDGETTQKLPNWNYNPEICNKSGKINIMFLDSAGGKNAFSKDFLAEDNNIVLKLKFRLRNSIYKGDVCDLIFEDAVFAASNESESLAVTKGTLKVKNGKIVVGE